MRELTKNEVEATAGGYQLPTLTPQLPQLPIPDPNGPFPPPLVPPPIN